MRSQNERLQDGQDLGSDSFDDNFKDDDLNNDDFFDSSGDDNIFGDFDEGREPMEKHKELLKELTNFEPQVRRMFKNWLGLDWDEETKSVRQIREPLINEIGAWRAISIIQTYRDKTNILTNLDKDEYKSMKIEIIEQCWLWFLSGCRKYKFKDPEEAAHMAQQLQHSCYLVLGGVGDGKYSQVLKDTHRHTENTGGNMNMGMGRQQQNKGWFDNFKDKMLGRA